MALTPFFSDEFFGPLFPTQPRVRSLFMNDPDTSGLMRRGIALDIVEKPERFEMRADLPGVTKDDIKLNVDGDVVSLSVEKSSEQEEEKEEEGVKYHRMERSSAFQRRSVRLPESANLENIEAKFDNGVLNLTIPKKPETAKTRQITVS